MMSLTARRARIFLRQPPRPRWYWPVMHLGGIGLGLAVGLGAGYWLGGSGRLDQALTAITGQAIALTGAAGLTVREVYADGRLRTERELLAQQLGIEVGQPILALDTDELKERLEALPWIEQASVVRLLPDTIRVRVQERKPLAIWQHEGRLALIDRDGVVIEDNLPPEVAAQHAYLRVLVGADAPAHAAALFAVLSTEPELSARVVAATWVGDRRWTLRLDNKIDVLLPEQAMQDAWRLLALKAREEALLERAIAVIDLRFLPDRIRLQLDPVAVGDQSA
jgi:cell division protein FtsQ